MLRDNIQVVTIFALRYSSLQCRLISMVLIGIRQSPIFGFFESAPEVRVLCSAGITRHQRSYDPVRLPPGPSPESDVEAATLIPNGPPPITQTTLPTCRAHYPGGSNGCACRFLPRSYSLPQMAGGSASALSLSRPAYMRRCFVKAVAPLFLFHSSFCLVLNVHPSVPAPFNRTSVARKICQGRCDSAARRACP